VTKRLSNCTESVIKRVSNYTETESDFQPMNHRALETSKLQIDFSYCS